jgi:hypothetical protein
MIYFLDEHPTKCAGYYAVDHLKSTTREAIQVLSDATRLIIEECRIHSLEKKMVDVRHDVKDERYWAGLERDCPLPMKDQDDPLVLWCVEDQDAWDWMMEFISGLLMETRNWVGKGPDQADVDGACWLRVNAPRPVNAGRILRRRLLFPLSAKVPKEFISSDLFASDVPQRTKLELTVRAYRLMYWTRFKSSMRYTSSRRPWWWGSLGCVHATPLASNDPEK